MPFKWKGLCRGRILTTVLGGEKLGKWVDFNSDIKLIGKPRLCITQRERKSIRREGVSSGTKKRAEQRSWGAASIQGHRVPLMKE